MAQRVVIFPATIISTFDNKCLVRFKTMGGELVDRFAINTAKRNDTENVKIKATFDTNDKTLLVETL